MALVAVPAAGSAAGGVGKARLTISVWPEGRGAGKPVQTSTLRCRPAGGTHPAPVNACRRLFANVGALRPVPPGAACTVQFGGPQQALVRGKLRGRRVRSLLSRTNGCEIARWNRLVPVVPAPGPVTPPPPRPPVEASLEIIVWPRGLEGPSRRLTLTCAPAGGTHASPAAACRRLASLRNPFAEIPSEMMCALVFGGPQVAVVRGRFRGTAVDARFSRTDGCEIRRWDRHAFLFGGS